MNATRTATVLLVLLMAGATISAAGADDAFTAERQRDILHRALSDYDDAVALARSDPTRASELYRQSAAGFQALQDAGLNTAALEYNLGNVYFRLGELGRAILHYRRAQRLAPADERLAANLRYARDRVEPAIAPSGQRRLTHQLLFWHYNTAPGQRLSALLLLSGCGWLLLLAWLRRRARLLAGLGVAGVALALAIGASLLWQLRDEARYPHVVVVGHEVHLRLGRGEGADPALKQPLGPGVEARIIQRRGDWIEVRLRNDQAGWLPAAAAEGI